MTQPTPTPRRGRAWLIAAAVLAAMAGMFTLGLNADTDPAAKGTRPDAAKTAGALPILSAATPEQSDTEAGPQELKVGEAFTLGEFVTVAVTDATVRTSPSDPEFSEPPVNGAFLTATVNIQAIQAVEVADISWFVRTETGQRYEVGDGNAWMETRDDSLAWAPLNAGEQITGTLTFDVPIGTVELAYAPQGGPAVAVWALSTEGA